MRSSRDRLVHPLRRLAQARCPARRLNEIVTAGNWPKWFTVSGPAVRGVLDHRVQRHQLARSPSAHTASTARPDRAGIAAPPPAITRYWLAGCRSSRPARCAVRRVQRVLDLVRRHAQRLGPVAVDIDVSPAGSRSADRELMSESPATPASCAIEQSAPRRKSPPDSRSAASIDTRSCRNCAADRDRRRVLHERQDARHAEQHRPHLGR